MKTNSLERTAPAVSIAPAPIATRRPWATISAVPSTRHRSATEKRMFFVMMAMLSVFALAMARYIVAPATQSLATSSSQEWLADGP